MKRPAWFPLTQFKMDTESVKLKTLEAFSNLINEAKSNFTSVGTSSKWLQLDWIDVTAIDAVLSDYLNGIIPSPAIKINGQDLPPFESLAQEYEDKTWALKPVGKPVAI
jgi:hypothetical protein